MWWFRSSYVNEKIDDGFVDIEANRDQEMKSIESDFVKTPDSKVPYPSFTPTLSYQSESGFQNIRSMEQLPGPKGSSSSSSSSAPKTQAEINEMIQRIESSQRVDDTCCACSII